MSGEESTRDEIGEEKTKKAKSREPCGSLLNAMAAIEPLTNFSREAT